MKDEGIEIKVYGRVQGVNLRSMIRKKALELEIRGLVMNRDDGSVEIAAQGKRKALLEILNWIEKNPGFSSVKGLSYHWGNPSREFDDFKIVKTEPLLIDKVKSLLMLGKNIFKKENKGVPRHVVVIPDGNRRWAKQKGLEPSLGHYTSASFQHLKELFQEARNLGVKYLSLWGFSTENWKRNQHEINAIFDLISKNIGQFREEAHATKIRFRHLGRKDRLPKYLLRELEKLEEETKNYTEFNVQLCLDYGGRDELLRAVDSMIKNGEREISEEKFEKYLDSYGIPDPDLIIRTSGEQRLSGFMPFQAVYAELYFSQKHFPDFDGRELRKAVVDYGNRQRRFGAG